MHVDYALPIANPSQPVPLEVTVGAASAASAAFNATTAAVLLCATQDCRIIFGTAPVALATSTLLPAGVPVPFQVLKGQAWKVAAIQESAAGKLSITEMTE